MADGAAPEYREIVLKTLREKEWRDGKGFGVWVVQTVKDGKSFKVQVRAGMYKPNRVTGEKELPKDGLDEGDFKLIHVAETWKAIEELLRIQKGTAVAPAGSELDPAEKAAPPEPETPPWLR
ncbi:MAG: hypothetical protein V4510_09860 [bacterium]